MKNGKHKTNSFDSLNSWSKKTNFLPSFQGGVGGRLSSFLPFREGPGVGFSPCQARLSHKISVPSVSGVSGVSSVTIQLCNNMGALSVGMLF